MQLSGCGSGATDNLNRTDNPWQTEHREHARARAHTNCMCVCVRACVCVRVSSTRSISDFQTKAIKYSDSIIAVLIFGVRPFNTRPPPPLRSSFNTQSQRANRLKLLRNSVITGEQGRALPAPGRCGRGCDRPSSPLQRTQEINKFANAK